MSATSGALNGRYTTLGEGEVPEACKRIIKPGQKGKGKIIASAKQYRTPVTTLLFLAFMIFIGSTSFGLVAAERLGFLEMSAFFTQEEGLQIKRLDPGIETYPLDYEKALWNCSGTYTSERLNDSVCIRVDSVS